MCLLHEADHFNRFLTHTGLSYSEALTPEANSELKLDGGEMLENHLFGQILNTLDLNQATYLMNSLNWGKSSDEFTKGFNQLQKSDEKIKFKSLTKRSKRSHCKPNIYK